MKLYLDTAALISFLYSPPEEQDRAFKVQQLFTRAREDVVELVVSFYVLPELYNHVLNSYAASHINLVFRESLLLLFGEPVTVVPNLDRLEANRLRRRFSIPDSYDALHVACALFHQCDAIVTYDSHFQTVTNVIDVLTPPQALGRLSTP